MTMARDEVCAGISGGEYAHNQESKDGYDSDLTFWESLDEQMECRGE